MGIGLYLEFNPALSDIELPSDGKLLFHVSKALDEVCDAVGIKHFSYFGNNIALPLSFVTGQKELEELLNKQQWFNINEGLHMINTLIISLERSREFDYLFLDVDPDFVLEELKDLKGCLLRAQNQASEFRFQIA
jgi:hypothetical protein